MENLGMDGRLRPFEPQIELPARLAEAVGELRPLGAEGGRAGMHIAQVLGGARHEADTALGRRHDAAALRARPGQRHRGYSEGVARQPQRQLHAQVQQRLALDRLTERNEDLAPATLRPDIHIALDNRLAGHADQRPARIGIRHELHLAHRRVAHVEPDGGVERQPSLGNVDQQVDLAAQRGDNVIRAQRQRVGQRGVLVGEDAAGG
jgi:hypothetical protein